MTYNIRKMQKEDIRQVQQVAKVSWNSTYINIIPHDIQSKFLATAYSDEMMERRLEVSNVYVAEENEKVIGFANFSNVKNGGEVELAAIYLEPSYQGKGIGTVLLKTGINEQTFVKKVYINVEEKNIIGRRFYEAKGFKELEEFDDELYGHISKMIRMVYEIN